MSSPREAEGPLAAERIVGTFTATARLLIAALGVLYTAGLLIVNIDLSRYGVSNLDLARPEYVMAGALWALTTVPSGIVAVVFYRLANERIQRRERGVAVATFVGLILLGIGLPTIVLSILFSVPQGPPFGIPRTVVAFHTFTMLLNVGLVTALATVFQKGAQAFSGLAEPKFRLLNAGLATSLTIMALAIMIVSYSVLSFPFLKREFGGGYKAVVELILVEQAPVSWDSFDLPISSDRSKIGPVFLLFESQNGLVVTRWLAGPILGPVSMDEMGPHATLESVAIERKAVAVVVYKGPWTFND